MAYSTAIKVVLWTTKMFAEIAFLPIHVLRLFLKREKCPPIKNDVLLLSATELAQRIRKREISCVKVLKAYISRINEVNPIINAVIEDRFQDALEDAKKVDMFLLHSDLNQEQIAQKYPLLGVPITIKESIAVKGMLHSAGHVEHTSRAEKDATAVKHVKDAGAIPLLVSNVPELCLNWETVNKLIGTTSNPYDHTRTSGGSSGGEASLLACGASAIGLGSDVAGSIRVPAHYCGIWGHKPSPSVVSCLGHYPESKNLEEWEKFFAIGPLTRYASDLKLLLNVILEPGGKELLKLDQPVDLTKIKVYYMGNIDSVLVSPLNNDVTKGIERVITHFNSICETKCTEVHFPPMKYFAELSYLRITVMNMNIDNFFDGKDAKVYYELLKFLGGKSNHVLGALGYGIIKHFVTNFVPENTVNNMFVYFDELREQFLEILGDDGVLIVATSPSEAVYHKDVYRKMYDYGYCAFFNILGFPATSCPTGFTANGLPVGIQVVAAPNLDRLTLSVAEELEKKFGGWKFY